MWIYRRAIIARRKHRPSAPFGALNPPDTQTSSVSPCMWMPEVSRWWKWNVAWLSLAYNAHHTPAILMIGKSWSWGWAVPCLQIPLACITGLYPIRAPNLTWGSIWVGVRAVITESDISISVLRAISSIGSSTLVCASWCAPLIYACCALAAYD